MARSDCRLGRVAAELRRCYARLESAGIDVRNDSLRLDVIVVERGLAHTRERAQALILAGQVKVDGRVISKAGARVAGQARVELVAADHPYVGRGGVKLAAGARYRRFDRWVYRCVVATWRSERDCT